MCAADEGIATVVIKSVVLLGSHNGTGRGTKTDHHVRDGFPVKHCAGMLTRFAHTATQIETICGKPIQNPNIPIPVSETTIPIAGTALP